MKTIRQIANEIGVSKQAVYKRIRGSLHTVVAPYAHTVDGVVCVSEQGEELIKQAFGKNIAYDGAHTECIQNTETDTVQSLIKMLKEELEMKNEQIRGLSERLAESNIALVTAQQSLQAAQMLHGGTMQKHLTDGSDKQDKPKGFLARLFSSGE
ncbi:MAG: hypothetical protein FWC91_10260 [Defluviitaleaceae bacterium]|nr:hypothetical protein [Defluviitaleaceae bacterium]